MEKSLRIGMPSRKMLPGTQDFEDRRRNGYIHKKCPMAHPDFNPSGHNSAATLNHLVAHCLAAADSGCVNAASVFRAPAKKLGETA
jgi:hypothetical protein